MSELNTEYLGKCLETLKKSYAMMKTVEADTIEYEMCRNSLVKSFEMTLEQCEKLLRKKLVPYFATKKEADRLTFKDVFRHALKYSLMDEDSVRRWFSYRDNINNTTHDYGQNFANDTLNIIEKFIADATALKRVIDE